MKYGLWTPARRAFCPYLICYGPCGATNHRSDPAWFIFEMAKDWRFTVFSRVDQKILAVHMLGLIYALPVRLFSYSNRICTRRADASVLSQTWLSCTLTVLCEMLIKKEYSNNFQTSRCYSMLLKSGCPFCEFVKCNEARFFFIEN
jgi:hypothetical protein